MDKIDGNLVNALCVEDRTTAIVRVSNPWQMNYIARNFDVVAAFPFIRSLGIRCNRDEVVRLADMREVESVSAQGRVCALNGDVKKKSALECGKCPVSALYEGGVETAEGGRSDADFAEVFSLHGGGLTGAGVGLCIMDTGISPHSDFSIPRDRIKVFKDFVGGAEYPYDDNGHGTFVTGVAAGNGCLSATKIKGIAPCADLVGVKVIGASGETGTFKILEGMQWVFDNAVKLGVKVVCMSFGADPLASADPLKAGAEMLARRGLTVVCAAGNSGAGGLKSPGISTEVITVGAVDEELKVASFSSSGVYQGAYRPDVYAVGVRVRGVEAGGTYSTMSGTSVSAPYVAGACCLLHQKYARLTPRDAKRMIIAASREVGGVMVFNPF